MEAADYTDQSEQCSEIPKLEKPYMDNSVHYRHLACLHPHQGTWDEGMSLSITFNYEIEDAPPTLRLIQPRWCPYCLISRMKALYESYRRRLDERGIPEQYRETENFMEKRGYIRGVRDGRILGLAMPLEELAQLEASSAEETRTAELEERMEDLRIAGLQPEVDPKDEELSRLFDQQSLTHDDDLEKAMERAFVEDHAYAQGMRDGRILQAKAEEMALDQYDPGIRERMLERSIL